LLLRIGVSSEEEDMRSRRLVAGIATLVLAGGGIGVGVAASGGDDPDTQATGPGADRARAAALAHIPGGTATGVERDAEDGATWEVEVRRPDGASVDVRLDDRFAVVAVDADREDADAGED
jgi:hypothetical protein